MSWPNRKWVQSSVDGLIDKETKLPLLIVNDEGNPLWSSREPTPYDKIERECAEENAREFKEAQRNDI